MTVNIPEGHHNPSEYMKFTMNYITVGKENSHNIEIYYEDWGSGQPVVDPSHRKDSRRSPTTICRNSE